ncbi:MAG TPA: CotH kinase family protein [Verrucomicrobiae bacterium]|nr:CotH kinase family protein [Verrucomicrobiae bacterium]
MGIGLHGSSSLGFPKQPYTIELDDETGASLDYGLLGFPAGSDWVLRASYDDKTFLNEVLTHQLFAQMGHYAVRTRYVELFLHNGPGKLSAQDYHGLYFLVEHVRVAANRVNIAKMDSTDNLAPDVTGGYLFSKDKFDPSTDLVFTTSSGQQLVFLYPKSDKVTQPQFDYLTGYINDFESVLYGANWRDPVSGYSRYIDVDSFVDFHWIVEYSKNIDGIRISNYMNKDRGGKIKTEPIWDWDLSWGNANYLDGAHTNGWYYPQLGAGDDIWFSQLRTDPDFYQKIIDRWGALRMNVFNPTNLLSRIDSATNYLKEAQARDFAAWPRLGDYVWPNPDGAASGWDVDYVTPTTYAGIIAQMKKFVVGRYTWIDHQFLGAPVLSTNGTALAMSAPAGAVYYTLDGTDPRSSGGGISAAAHLYQGQLQLTNNAALFARASLTNAWSPPAKLLWLTSIPPLRITEINYNPAPPPVGSPYNDKDFEFVEVQNTGTSPINLAGTHIGGGIDYTFAPSEWVRLGTLTTNDWDNPGTPFSASTLGQAPGPYTTNDTPGQVSLTLLNTSSTNTSRNRITFSQTSTGACQRVVADFDFRATTQAPTALDGSPTLQDFDSAGTTYTLTQNGSTAPTVMPPDAGSSGSYVRLVPSSGNQLGVIAFDRTATNAYRSIVATFDFRITPPSGSSPADGFGFALLNTAAYGANGAGPFFSEEPNLTSSLGVGFDVYANASTPQEPNNNHISLHWNGAQVGNAASPSFLMANGKFHRAQIIIWFWGGNAYTTVRLTPDINGTPGPTETVFQEALIPSGGPYQSRVAFGARTGGLWATHDLDNIHVQFTQNLAAEVGFSLEFLPVSRFGASGPGSTLSDFIDWPTTKNVLALDLTFNPADLFNNASVYWNAAPVTSIVLPPATINLDNGQFHHAHLQLDSGNGGAYATLSLTPNSLGSPGLPVNAVTNLFIPGVNLGDSRLEFAARNGGLPSRIDLDNVAGEFSSLSPLILNPGESIVVVHNLDAFRSRYGSGPRVAGEFSGSLDNSGERLTLTGPLGEPILDFTYDPAWYPSTDGDGFSLVAVDPNAAPGVWGQMNNWRPSSQPGGSPGSLDPASAPVLSIRYLNGNQLELTWPAAAGSFALYSAADLGPVSDWTPVTNTPSLSGPNWTVSLPAADHPHFYRLQSRSP